MTGDPLANLRLFALGATRMLGERTAEALGCALAAHEMRTFEDGEHKARPLESVRGSDVYVLHGLHGDDRESPNDKLCQLLFFLAAMRDAGAARVTAVVPYLAYARKDRRTKTRDPVTTRYVASLLEAVGVDRVAVVDVHSPTAFQNAFRVPTEHVQARPVLVERLLPRLADQPVAVFSPDTGGASRAEVFRTSLEKALGRAVPFGFLEKRRSEGVVSGDLVVGEVEGRVVVLVDDLISTGATLARAAAACRRRGASRVLAVATHGLFVGGARSLIGSEALDAVLVTNTVPPFRLPPSLGGSVEVVDVAPLLAEAVRRMHLEESLAALFEAPDAGA